MNISEIRKKYPQYDDISDEELARGFHGKFYSDMPYEEFASKIGIGKMVTVGGGKSGPVGKRYLSPSDLQYAEERNTIAKSLSKLPGDIGTALDDFMRLTANATSLGYADKAAAAANSMLGGADYQSQLAQERQKTQEATKRLGPAAPMADVAGMTLATPILGAISPTAKFAPALQGSFAGRNIAVPAISAAEGAVYGGISASAADKDVMGGALSGAAIGGAIPFAANAITGLVKAGLNYTQMRNWANTSKLSPGQKAAFDSTLAELEASGLTPSQALANAQALGPSGTIADVTPGLQLATGAVASKEPGAANIITKNLMPRFEAAPKSMEDVLTKNIGPVTDPQSVRSATDALRKGASPLFENVEKYAVPVDDTMKIISEGIKTYGPNSSVGKMLTEARKKLTDRSGNLISNGRAVVGVRDEIQIMLDEAYKKSGTLGNAFKPVRDSLNNSIITSIPDRKIANELWRGSKLMDEAYDYGRTLLSGGPSAVTPGQLNEYLMKLRKENPEAAKMVVQGFRTELDRLTQGQRAVGGKVERILEQPYNREKLNILVGPEAAKNIAAEVAKQATQLQTLNAAIPSRNSLTAVKQEAMSRMFPEQGVSGGYLPEMASAAIGGLMGGPQGAVMGAGATALRRIGKKAADALSKRDYAEQAQWMASFLTSSGQEQAAMVKQLEKYAESLNRQTPAGVTKAEAIRRGILPKSGIIGGLLSTGNE